MRGAWVGFSWGHTQAHFFRAILESIAFEYAYYLGILRELVPDLALVEARVIGGGARSDRWNQIKADVLGVPYQRLQRAEFATWGSALIAGRRRRAVSRPGERGLERGGTARGAHPAAGRPGAGLPGTGRPLCRLAASIERGLPLRLARIGYHARLSFH